MDWKYRKNEEKEKRQQLKPTSVSSWAESVRITALQTTEDFTGSDKGLFVFSHITQNLEVDSCWHWFSTSVMLGLTSSPLQDNCHNSSHHIWVSGRWKTVGYCQLSLYYSSRTTSLPQYTYVIGQLVTWSPLAAEECGKASFVWVYFLCKQNPGSVSKEEKNTWYYTDNINGLWKFIETGCAKEAHMTSGT